MRESTIEGKVCKAAKRLGWEVRKITSPSHRGMPDRMFYRRGKVVFCEFKAPGKKATKLQRREILKMHSHDISCWVIDNVDAGIRMLDCYE